MEPKSTDWVDWPVAEVATWAIRVACVALMSAWAGGFAFYGGVVVPTLHDLMSTLEASEVTRRVTLRLNLVGIAALAAWWAAGLATSAFRGRAGRARLALMVAASASVGGLVALHARMSEILDGGSRDGFYPFHRAYLGLSTLAWIVALALMAVGPVGDRRSPAGGRTP